MKFPQEAKDYLESRKCEPSSPYGDFQKQKTTHEGREALGVVFGRKGPDKFGVNAVPIRMRRCRIAHVALARYVHPARNMSAC